MGRMYTCPFSGVSSTAQLDLIEIAAPSTMAVAIHEICISQGTEVTDAEEEMMLLHFKSGVTSGSGGTAGTEVPLAAGDPAASAVVEYGNTTKATGGVTHHSWYWNIRMPFQMIFTPETRPVLAPSRVACVELASQPVDSVTFGGYIVFEELG